jgi:anaerobic magnesium-protoporphyrin IX monomethyl ester cyclase
MSCALNMLLVNPHRTDPESEGVGCPNFHQCRFDTPGKICSSTNVGLVSLATRLAREGFRVEVLDLDGCVDPGNLLERTLIEASPQLIGFSCLFHTTYLSVISLATVAHRTCPKANIVAGGSHVAAVAREALDAVPCLDGVVVGEGESVLPLLLSRPPTEWHKIAGVRTRSGGCGTGQPLPLEYLDSTAYPGYRSPILVVEESRGCPYSCAFCSHSAQFRTKPLDTVEKEIWSYLQATECEFPEIIIASDTLGLNATRLNALVELLIAAQRIRPFQWGSQTRADCVAFTDPSLRDRLRRSGLRSLSVGLESASPSVIHRMGKSNNPAAYLDSASTIMRNIGRIDGVRLRLNILLYAGETAATLCETRNFLDSHRPYFAGIHTSVVHAYPGTRLWTQIDEFANSHGTSRVLGLYWNKVHAYPLNPSRDLTFDEAERIAREWREEFVRKPS